MKAAAATLFTEAPPHKSRLRWGKVWVSDCGRGNVQVYTTANGLRLFDAWLDGKVIGQCHRAVTAKKMVRDAIAAGDAEE